MGLTRKKYIVNKKFQYGMTFKAILLPLATLFIISALLLYFTGKSGSLIEKNNRTIDMIVENQDQMINLFLSTPELQNSGDDTVARGVTTFKNNIGMLKKITENSAEITKNNTIVFYVLIAMAVIQTILVFMLFIVISHRVSGPLLVMMSHLKELQNGGQPDFRPLRKRDEFQDFYQELQKTLQLMHVDKSPKKND